jgi:hypothetical protein
VKWCQINPKCLESEDGRWTILKFKRGEEMRYALIRLGKPSRWEFEGATAQECKEKVNEFLRIAA